ncbi:hypothetical protein [Bacillus cabrialesii]
MRKWEFLASAKGILQLAGGEENVRFLLNKGFSLFQGYESHHLPSSMQVEAEPAYNFSERPSLVLDQPIIDSSAACISIGFRNQFLPFHKTAALKKEYQTY